jgi:hypothetical protein
LPEDDFNGVAVSYVIVPLNALPNPAVPSFDVTIRLNDNIIKVADAGELAINAKRTEANPIFIRRL